MLSSFTDKLKPFFNFPSNILIESHSPDPLTYLPPSTQILPKKRLSESNHPSLKISHSIPTEYSDIKRAHTPLTVKPDALQQEGRDSPTNIAAIRTLLNTFPLALRLLIIQQPKTCTHKSPIILFDTRDVTSSCRECQRVFSPDLMSEVVFGNCYLVTPPSCLKLQTLHTDCVILSKVLCHNATHLIRSNHSSTQFLSKLSNHEPISSLVAPTRCKTATSSRPHIDRDMSAFTKPLSSSLDSKFSKKPDSIFNSHGSLHSATEGLFMSGHSDYVIRPYSPAELSNSPTKSASKTRRLAIVLIFHEKEMHPTRIEELYANFLTLENFLNKLTDDIYDIIESATAATFPTSLSVAIEEFLKDLNSSFFTLSTANHLVPNNKTLSIHPIQLHNFAECPFNDIPHILTKLHSLLNCNIHTDFFSRFLTAFLTYHHSWLISSLEVDKCQKLSSHFEVIASRYGYSPASPFLCKIILLDQQKRLDQKLLSPIVTLLSYFFRQQLDVISPDKRETPTRDLTPSNEEFLIISMSLDSVDQHAPTSNIQCYTYNPLEEVEDPVSYENYQHVPLANDTSFTDIIEDDQLTAYTNRSILTYTSDDKNAAILQCANELKQLHSHLEGIPQDELFSLEDNLFELGSLSASLPPPTLIIADFDTYTVEVIHDDALVENYGREDVLLTRMQSQKRSKLIHSLLEMVSSICQPLLSEEETAEAGAVNAEIALVYLENSLEDLQRKAEIVVQHLKSKLEAGNCLEDNNRAHEFFSELVGLMRLDGSDLQLLFRIAYVIAPEERNALEKLLTFVLSY